MVQYFQTILSVFHTAQERAVLLASGYRQSITISTSFWLVSYLEPVILQFSKRFQAFSDGHCCV